MHKCSIVYEVNYVNDAIGSNGNVHAYKCWCCRRGRPIQVLYMYLSRRGASFNYSYYYHQHFLPICNGLFDLMGGEWLICMSSSAKTVCALNFKFAIDREQGWDHLHCKFQTNLLKSVATALIVRKLSFFGRNHRFWILHFNVL